MGAGEGVPVTPLSELGGRGESPKDASKSKESNGLEGYPAEVLYKISCMKRVTSPGSMHDTGCLGLVHWDNPEVWYEEGEGRTVFLPGEPQGRGSLVGCHLWGRTESDTTEVT